MDRIHLDKSCFDPLDRLFVLYKFRQHVWFGESLLDDLGPGQVDLNIWAFDSSRPLDLQPSVPFLGVNTLNCYENNKLEF